MAKNLPARAQTPQDTLMAGFKDDLTQIVPYLESLLPGKGAVARFQRMSQFAVLRDPKLLECTKKSLLLALLWCAQKDLEPGVEDGCWIIPFKGKATPIPAYKGLIKKAIEVGAARSIDAYAVYEHDDFYYEYGIDPKMHHIPPKLGTSRGAIIGAYVVITLPEGEKKHRVMDREQIERIRNAGAAWKSAPESGPWHDWEEAMFLKTIIKQGLKTIPMRADLRDLLADDNLIEVGSGVGALLESAGAEVPADLQGSDESEETTKKTDTAAFDSMVHEELSKLPAGQARDQLLHLEENLRLSAKNTKKTIGAFKTYAAPFFHPYVNDKGEKKEGYWKTFLAWEAAQYPASPTPEPTTGFQEPEGPAEPGPTGPIEPEIVNGNEGAAVEASFETRNKALVMEILRIPVPLADLELNNLAEITPENIAEIEGKVKNWATQAKKKK